MHTTPYCPKTGQLWNQGITMNFPYQRADQMRRTAVGGLSQEAGRAFHPGLKLADQTTLMRAQFRPERRLDVRLCVICPSLLFLGILVLVTYQSSLAGTNF